MHYDPATHHRRSIRLLGFDDTRNGAYFVTILTHRRWPLFGAVVNGVMRLSEAGRLAQAAWDDLPIHYPQVTLDAWVIMPDHVHGVLWLSGAGGGTDAPLVSALPPYPGSTRRAGRKPISLAISSMS